MHSVKGVASAANGTPIPTRQQCGSSYSSMALKNADELLPHAATLPVKSATFEI